MADLPVAGIVCLAVGGYVLVIVGIAVLCYFLKGRGKCGDSRCCAKEEGAQSCECCMAMSEACNCCKSPSLTSCLDSCCPNRKRITCVDIIMCQCCASEGGTLCDGLCCGRWKPGNGRLCKSKLGCCQRNKEDTCNCLCLEIRMRSPRDSHVTDLKFPPHAGSGDGTKVKDAWMAQTGPVFRANPYLTNDEAGYRQFYEGVWDGSGKKTRGPGRGDLPGDLQLDLGYFRSGAPPHPAAHPVNTDRSETCGDFVPTSTPRFHHGQSQLFIRPGVYSVGRVMAKRQQSGPWPPLQSVAGAAAAATVPGTRRRSHWRRHSSSLKRRASSPTHHHHHRSRSPNRQRSPGQTTVVRPFSRRHSHKDSHARWAQENLQR